LFVINKEEIVMNVAFLVFSPSGNGVKAARRIGSLLAARAIEAQVVDLTGDESWFRGPPSGGRLEDLVPRHDLLCVAAPVYAHHLQYHMKDAVSLLPRPNGKWGALALPILSYGGFSTGVALKEAARLLERSGRRVVGAARVAAPHAISRLPQIRVKMNFDRPGTAEEALFEDIADAIAAALAGNLPEPGTVLKQLGFPSPIARLKAALVFRERLFQRRVYPRLSFDASRCAGCGACADACAVRRLEVAEGKAGFRDGLQECIHCGNCILACPRGALSFAADFAVWNELFEKSRRGSGPMVSRETPDSAFFGGERKEAPVGR